MTPPKKSPPTKRLPSEAKSARTDADRRVRQADRLSRVMRMLQLLLSRGRWNTRDLAAEQECSERTIYQDKQVLELAGIPVEYEQDDRCFRIRQDFRFTSLNITDEEALGQGTATAITTGLGLDINVGTKPVTRKLAVTSKADIGQILADAEEMVAVLDLKLADHSRHREHLHTIQWALVKRKQLTGTYCSPHETADVKVRLHAFRLCLIKQAWYLIARPEGEDSPRTYRAARFKTLRMLDANASIPEDFDIKAYFGNAWAVYRGERSYDVEILFNPEAGATVTEGIWHPTQKAHRHKDGSVTLMFKVDGLNEIVRWILGWGSRAQVIQPPELRSLLVDQLKLSLEAYQS